MTKKYFLKNTSFDLIFNGMYSQGLRRLKTFHDFHLGLYLVCLVQFSSCFIHLDKQQRHEHCLDYTVIFSKQEVSRRWVACGSPGENKCL